MKKKVLLTLFLAFVMLGATACYAPEDGQPSGSVSNTASATDSGTDSEDSSSTNSESNSSTDSEDNSSTDSESSEEKERYYTVSFDTDGAGDIEPVQVLAGETVPEPTPPNKTNTECEYTFLGWYLGEEKWDFEKDVVTENITLVAHWQEGDKYSNPFLPKD